MKKLSLEYRPDPGRTDENTKTDPRNAQQGIRPFNFNLSKKPIRVQTGGTIP